MGGIEDIEAVFQFQLAPAAVMQRQHRQQHTPEAVIRILKELDEFAELADEILKLLMEYDEQVQVNFRGLSRRVDFRNPPRR